MTDQAVPTDDVWLQLSVLPDDYRWAVVHLAWRGTPGTDGKTINELAFGMIELLPTEFPRPSPEPSQSLSLHSGRAGKLRTMRDVAPAATAAAWFRDARLDAPRFPPLPDGKQGPAGLQVAATLWEPEWPYVSTVLAGHSDDVPYVPASHECPRLIHRVCPGSALFDDLSANERRDAFSFLAEQLAVSFDRFPELVGSLHLVLPNPVHRRPEVRFAPENRQMFVQLTPRPRRTLGGLELLVRNERSTGASSLLRIPLGAEFTTVQFREPIDHVALDVICSQRGLIHAQGPTTWAGTVELGMRMVGQRRQVRIAGKAGEPADEYTVDVASTETSVVGEPAPTSARTVIAAAKEKRRILGEAERYRQQVFVRNRADATGFLRGIVGGARDRLTMVDPYFGVRELYDFALASQERDLPVRVLTWVGHVKGRETRDGERHAEALSRAVAALRSRDGVGEIEVLVMGDSNAAAIHDRFIVRDGECWLLGSSLNSFGTAGTACLRMPNPDPVIAMIDSEIVRAQTLPHWIATHPLPPAPTSRARVYDAFKRFANELRTIGGR